MGTRLALMSARILKDRDRDMRTGHHEDDPDLLGLPSLCPLLWIVLVFFVELDEL